MILIFLLLVYQCVVPNYVFVLKGNPYKRPTPSRRLPRTNLQVKIVHQGFKNRTHSAMAVLWASYLKKMFISAGIGKINISTQSHLLLLSVSVEISLFFYDLLGYIGSSLIRNNGFSDPASGQIPVCNLSLSLSSTFQSMLFQKICSNGFWLIIDRIYSFWLR